MCVITAVSIVFTRICDCCSSWGKLWCCLLVLLTCPQMQYVGELTQATANNYVASGTGTTESKIIGYDIGNNLPACTIPGCTQQVAVP